MKKFIVLFLLLFLVNYNNYAIDDFQPQTKLQSSSSSKPTYNKPSYLAYYYWDPFDDNMNMQFNVISKVEYKYLDKAKKKTYKIILKYNKKLKNGWYGDVLYYNNTFLPALIQAYKMSIAKKAYRDAVIYLERIKKQNDAYNIFDTEMVDTNLGYTYWDDKDYLNAIKMLKPYMENNIYKKVSVGMIYFDMGNYNNSLSILTKINKDDIDLQSYKDILDKKYISYFRLKNYNNANKIAYELYSYSYPDVKSASLRIAATTYDKNLKMKFYKIAKEKSVSTEDIWSVNFLIGNLLDENLKTKSNTITGYFKPLLWSEITSKDSKYMSIQKQNQRFEDFYNDSSYCITKFTSNNLKSCLNDIKAKQNAISNRLVTEYQELNRQIAENERIMQLQNINYNMMEQNSLIRQQNYELSRPRYTNSTTTKYGNTYYTNTYSY